MEFNGYILAGGKSQRMGTDKGLLALNGKPFVSVIYNELIKVCNQVIIVTSNVAYKELGYKTIEDNLPNKGPVGGIFTALSHSLLPNNFIISVDAPFVRYDLLQWIQKNHQNKQNTIIKAGLLEIPLIAIYHSEFLSVFEDNLKQDNLKLRSVIHQTNLNILDCPKEYLLQTVNINTQEEYLNYIK